MNKLSMLLLLAAFAGSIFLAGCKTHDDDMDMHHDGVHHMDGGHGHMNDKKMEKNRGVTEMDNDRVPATIGNTGDRM